MVKVKIEAWFCQPILVNFFQDIYKSPFFLCMYMCDFEKKNNLFIFGCTGSLLLCASFLQLLQGDITLCFTGFCLQWLLLLQRRLQQLRHMGLVVLRCVESSWTRCRTCIPCIGRWIFIHGTTRTVLCVPLDYALIIIMMTVTRLINAYSVAGTMQSTNKA